MEFVIGLLWFIALATVMVFGIWRIEVNTRRIEENTALLRLQLMVGRRTKGEWFAHRTHAQPLEHA